MIGSRYCLVAVLVLASVGGSYGQDEVCNSVADIALVVDSSGSITENTGNINHVNWQNVLSFLDLLVDGLAISPNAVHLAAVGFSSSAYNEYYFREEQDQTAIKLALEDFRYDGGTTNTTGGMRQVVSDMFSVSGGDRAGVRDIIILITDGDPSESIADNAFLFDVVDDIKNNREIRIIGIGVTASVNVEIMSRVVSTPVIDNWFPVTDFGALAQILDTIVEETCRTIKPQEPTAPPSLDCATDPDVVMILDSSGSIDQNNWDTMVRVMGELAMDLPTDNNRVRLAVLSYSDNVREDLTFSESATMTRLQIQERIAGLQYIRGTTNTAAALDQGRNLLASLSTRPAPRVIFLVTDGGSNDKGDTIVQARRAKAAGIAIIVVAVGSWIDRYELAQVASYPSDYNIVDVPNFVDFGNFKDNFRQHICDNVNECQQVNCANGGTCVNEIGYYWCRCPTGFAGQRCESPCRRGADVAFVVDASGSIGKDNFQREMDFVRELTLGLNIDAGDTRVAMETYASDVSVEFDLNDHSTLPAVLDATIAYYSAGTTNTAGAINTVNNQIFQDQNGARNGVPRRAVVMTDGRSNDESATWLQAQAARQRGISILAIGIGDNFRQRELDAISSGPYGQNVFTVGDFGSLADIRQQTIEAICDQFDECQSNPCGGRGQCVDLLNGYQCICNSGFTGRNCERSCSGDMDLTIVLDVSGSIRNDRFPTVVDFIISVLDELEISADRTRVAALKYSDDAEVQWMLDEYNTKSDVMSAMQFINFMGGRTHTASALSTMIDQMFVISAGNRANSPNRVLLFTDGNSNINEERTLPEAVRARIQGEHIVVIGVGEDLNILEMSGMASEPASENVITVNSFVDLPSIRDAVVNSICDDNNECSSNPCANNGVCRNLLNRYWCDCRTSWTGQRCQRSCNRQVDVCIAVDLSGSIDVVYEMILPFVREFTLGLPFSGSRARVGVIEYRDNADVVFNLDEYTTAAEVRNALVFLRAGGRTNTQEALRFVYQNCFNTNGDRGGIDNIGVLISDGKSNVNAGNTIQEANNARNRNIEMFVVAVGDAPDLGEVNAIANTPSHQHVVNLPNPGSVSSAASALLDLVCDS